MKNRFLKNYLQSPLSFEENHGQTDTRVHFLSRGNGYQVFLTSKGAVISTSSIGNGNRPDRLTMELLGAQSPTKVTGVDQLPGKANYFIGNDRSRWHTNVPTYRTVRYEQIYEGINLSYYGNQHQLEYDFSVAARKDPGVIRVRFDERHKVRLEKNGSLTLDGGQGQFLLKSPIVYQQINGSKRMVSAAWVAAGKHEARFRIGEYDRQRELVIDPVVVYSTYIGGSDVDEVQAVTTDSSSNVYIAGATNSADFFPTPNGYQIHCANCTVGQAYKTSNAFVVKLDSNGAMVYSTYIGGTNGDAAYGIAVDANGNAYITGQTSSSDFPHVNNYQASFGGVRDAFVTSLNSTGTALNYSTWLGGTGDDYGRAIAVDASGNAYVTGVTQSTDFPTLSPIQSTCGPSNSCTANAFVTKYDSSGTKIYGTYLGGGGTDHGRGIALDSAGNVYVTGSTTSSGTSHFPTQNAIQSTCKLNAGTTCLGNAFVTEINSGGNAYVFSTYLGGSGTTVPIGSLGTFLVTTTGDSGDAIALDSSGNIYITGSTSSSDFPTSVGASSAACSTNKTLGACDNVFVAKLAPAGASVLFSTYLGGTGTAGSDGKLYGDSGLGIALDGSGNIFVAGITYSPDYPNFGGVQATCNSGSSAATPLADAFVTELTNAGAILDTACFGGTRGPSSAGPLAGVDGANAIAIDAQGAGIVAGSTYSSDFPAPSGLKSSLGGAQDGFVAKATGFIGGGNGAITCSKPAITQDLKNSLKITITASCTDTRGNSISSITINWGDPSNPTATSAGPTATYTYSAAGTFAITVSAVDSAGFGTSITECFALVQPPSNSVPQGQSITATAKVAAPPGVNSVAVTFSCAVIGPGSTKPEPVGNFSLGCETTPASMTMTNNLQPVSVTIKTNVASGSAEAQSRPAHGGVLLAFSVPVIGFVLFGSAGTKFRLNRLSRLLLLLMLGAAIISWVGCGGGSSAPPIPPPTQSNITPRGNYSVIVSGTDSSGLTQATVTVGFTVTLGGQ